MTVFKEDEIGEMEVWGNGYMQCGIRKPKQAANVMALHALCSSILVEKWQIGRFC